MTEDEYLNRQNQRKAGPDLYRALRDVLEDYQYCGDMGAPEDWHRRMKNAMAAIAKAEGRDHD